ncbi:MAG: D-isomer specific 2-hydroxyacid dehydrogenase, binding domain protein [Rhizobacter sp.]|nr:D-isomer specific 2-hydroxyacid dehydrogenase, binding domain protein [Rhizobacter sp.]
MKAVLHYRVSPALQARLAAAAPEWLQIATVDEADHSRVLRELADADVLLHVLAPATEQVLAAAPRLQLVQKIGVGVNTIDLAEARRRGIRVCNMPGTNSQAVCEATLALMLAALRKIVPFDAATRRGEGWAMPLGSTDDVGEISGRTVGLVGYGEVPRRLAPVLKALGARVLCHARRPVSDGVSEPVSLQRLLAESDIVSLHLPLTPETERLIGRQALDAMKAGAVLVNTARGGLVDEAALHAALRSGRLRAAGLDVLAEEPANHNNPLFDLPNVVFTPHVAWLTAETLERSLGVIVENCVRLREQRPLLHEIAL